MKGSGLFLFPEQASTLAAEVDGLYGFLVAMSLVLSVGIATTLLFFAIRYRKSADNQLATAVHGSLALEILWSGLPFIVAMGIFVWGASVFFHMSRPPDDAMEIFVVGKQWMWKLQHMEGRREINELHVPVGKPVKLTMTSEDVIHSFFIPAFRVKADVVPGRYAVTWFEATRPGVYHLFCAEYCGSEHSRMIGSVIAMEPADYQAWLAAGNLAGGAEVDLASLSPVERGARLFVQHGCPTCHVQGAATARIGPDLVGLYGKSVAMQGGGSVTADDAYLRESILNPLAKVVAGYQPVMPTFAGRMQEEDVMALLTYIKSLAAPGAPADAGPRGAS